MLDINLFRNNPEIIKADLKKRKYKNMLPFVDKIIDLDKKWRNLLKRIDKYKQIRNTVSKEIGIIKDVKKKQEKIITMKKNNEKIKKLDNDIKTIKKNLNSLLIQIPNIMDSSVPVGKDDSENVEIESYGKKRKFDFEVKDHQYLCEKNDWYDITHASKISGSRQYFLKNDLARLEFAIFSYTIDFLREKGFTFMTTPVMCYDKCFYGTGYLPAGKEDIYKIENENLSLIGTSEVPLTSFHMDETLLQKDLPKKYCGHSSCFRTEAGSHGKDEKGIFRVHEFKKIEMVILCTPEKSEKMHKYLLNTAKELWKNLGLHYRVVNICTGDLGVVASKKYDIEVWLPGQNKYREVVSCSNVKNYQSRRLNIKYRENEGLPPKDLVHTLNSTCITNTRSLIAIIENNQTKKGKVKIPKVLQPYMNGKKEI